MSDFWTRRRAAVQAEEAAQEAAARAASAAEAEARQAERSDAELLEEAGLPDPDTLVSPEEVQAFLRSALPQRLKTRALRKLWTMNPVLACLDGLNDYDDDYTDAVYAGQVVKTAYQVGQGFARRVLEEQAPDAPETPEMPEAAPAPEETPTIEMAEAVPERAPGTPALQPEPEPETDRAAPAPRRMRFSFET